MTLKNKLAIVTGASRGIGKAIAVGLAEHGAHVVIAARSETVQNVHLPGTISQTAAEIESAGGNALAVRCDVCDEKSVQNMVDQMVKRFGRVDILVNNAGVAFYYPVVETPFSRWDLVLRVNLHGTFLCSKAVLPVMIGQKSGSIVNISSLAANEREEGLIPTGVAYAAAKAAVDRFTWGLAAEVGRHNIAVNCLKPKAPVDTEGMRFWLNGKKKPRQWVTPEKMVKCALFLSDQDAKSVTGTVATDEELSAWHGL